MFKLETPLQKVPSLGTILIKRLFSVGITTVGDLFYFFPNRYDDFSLHREIRQLAIGETVTIKGQVLKADTTRTWKKKISLTEVYVDDGSGVIKAVWFNTPSAARMLAKGRYVQLSGKVAAKKDEPYLQHPNIEIITREQFEDQEVVPTTITYSGATGGITPVYPLVSGVSPHLLRKIIKKLLPLTQIDDFIPTDILRPGKFIDLATAFKQIHFPETSQGTDEARRRFAFEKMFLLQIRSLQVKMDWEKNQAVPIPFDEKFTQQFVSSLPFTLTSAQKKSAWQIIKDLGKNKPMNRLLEGDVGSGKTVVAALAALAVSRQKFQIAILAPTEVLALQHFQGIKKLFASLPIRFALLTGAHAELADNSKQTFPDQPTTDKTTARSKPSLTKKRQAVLADLSDGKVDLVIGTHALLQEKIRFKRLALVVIDEQHRFGVNQRAFLQQQALSADDGMKDSVPHLLTMTATPIPRTLALAVFGDLDLSILDEYPKGRKRIITQVVPKEKRDETYSFIQQQVDDGRQVFIICPLVEETSKMTEVKAATAEFERLKKDVFPGLSLGLLHGRMKAGDKEKVMNDFKAKKYAILVSTSVVEVGVDVPNATIMLIEGAERFGLSQLHQFRGRVGRGEHQSYCFLFTSNNAPESTRRLQAMQQTNDGFKIAEHDLKLRGPGQFLGTLQSGAPDIAMESLTDVKTIQSAREQALRILSFDPQLKKFPALKMQVQKLENMIHWE